AMYWLSSSDGLRRSLESQASAWLGEPVVIESAYARFLPRLRIHLQNVRIGSLHDSPDVDVVARGTLTIPTKALDAGADLVLSESLSKQAGTDLYRYTREGNRIVLPAIVGGTISQPQVRIDAAAAIRRGIRNEV